MYINKIDELVALIIDDFYNDIITTYVKTISMEQIKALVNSEDNMTTIFEIIKKYIVMYLFLYIGFFYKSKTDTYINNVIEFTRNQPTYTLKIPNFFNSDSNSLIIT